MSLRVAARLARRELRGGLRGFRIFLGCVILGVAAIAAVGTLRESVRAGLATQGAELLGGDAELEFTYRFATEAERAWMAENAARVSEIADFRSMAVAGDGRRELTQVKAVDSAYPLVGTVGLSPEMPLAAALAGADGLPGAVLEPVLANRLGIVPGDSFRLGEQSFRLMALLMREPDPSGAGFGLGPRSIVLRSALQGSGLLAPGALFSSRYRLDLAPGADLDTLAARAEAFGRELFASEARVAIVDISALRGPDRHRAAAVADVREACALLGAAFLVAGADAEWREALADASVPEEACVPTFGDALDAALRTLGLALRPRMKTRFERLLRGGPDRQ